MLVLDLSPQAAADVGPVTSARIVGDVRERFGGGDDPSALVAQETRTILGEPASIRLPQGRLGVVLVVGVNGSGKTTTIGKLAARLADQGKRVSIAGSDTFRAAAHGAASSWASWAWTAPSGPSPAFFRCSTGPRRGGTHCTAPTSAT